MFTVKASKPTDTANPRQNIIQRWIAKRTPKQDDWRLGLGNIYVFFSRQGVLFLLLLLITFVAGINYGNNLILGLFFYLLAIWFVSTVLTYLQLSAVQISLQDINLGQAQNLLWVSIRLTNHQGAAVRQLSVYFDKQDSSLLHPSDQQRYQQYHIHKIAALDNDVVVQLPVIATKRGVVSLPRLTIKTTYPLGIVQAWSYGFFGRTGLAYPAPKAFDYIAQVKTLAQQNNLGNFYQKGQDDFDGLDNYIAGESLSKVSWTHLARGMGMLTKQFADPIGQENVLDYANMPSLHHEDKLSELSYLVQRHTDSPFVLVLPTGVGQLGVGDEFIKACLIRLAKEP